MNLNVDETIGHIKEAISVSEKNRGVLIYTLQRVQQEMNYLPDHAMKMISEKLGIPLSDVYSTASFYKQFYFTPRGKKIVKVCTGTACHVRGASKVMEKLESEFDIKEGKTTPDLSMTLETVGCIGCCGLAPVATVNEYIVGEIDSAKIEEIIEAIKAE
ncbi:MAG: NADH-quinone oxidoreductase subunit NuoE [Nitrospirae bacterium]|nr:NADH-quinone oxidoreductase subunit NuoE [Nitrospirota bacterium]